MGENKMGFSIAHGWAVGKEELLAVSFSSNLLDVNNKGELGKGQYLLIDCPSIHDDLSGALIVGIMETTPEIDGEGERLYVHRKGLVVYEEKEEGEQVSEIVNLIHFMQIPEDQFANARRRKEIMIPLITPTAFKHGNIVVLEEVAGRYTTGRRIEYQLTNHHVTPLGGMTILHLTKPSKIKTQETEVRIENYIGVR